MSALTFWSDFLAREVDFSLHCRLELLLRYLANDLEGIELVGRPLKCNMDSDLSQIYARAGGNLARPSTNASIIDCSKTTTKGNWPLIVRLSK